MERRARAGIVRHRSPGLGATLALAVVAIGLVTPTGAAATSTPDQIVLNQVTASTLASLWFPITRDVDVPPACSATQPVECPGGVPRAASANLRLTRAALAALVYPPSRFEISADLRIDTLDPIALTFAGVDCSLTIDSSAGSSPTVSVVTHATLTDSPLLGYNFLEPGGPTVSGLEQADVALSGSVPCQLLGSALGLALDLVQEQLGDAISAHGPLCGVAAPDLVATCPWLTVDPSSVDFGDQAVGSPSAAQVLTITNAGPGYYPYVFGLGQVSIEGPAAADFAIDADGCSNSFLWSGSCTFEVIFTPSAAGIRSARLRVPNDWVEGPRIIELAGTGLAPADLAVGITAIQARAKGSTTVTYAITVSNAGPFTATEVSIADALPSQATFVSAAPSQGSCSTPPVGSSGSVTCSVGSLAIGSSLEIQVVVGVSARKATLGNTVTVTSTSTDPNLANNTATVSTRVK